MGNNDNSNGSFISKLYNSLENRIILLLAASLLGGSVSMGVVKTAPDARADKFTGTMATEMENRITTHIRSEIEKVLIQIGHVHDNSEHNKDIITTHVKLGAHGVAHERMNFLQRQIDECKVDCK